MNNVKNIYNEINLRLINVFFFFFFFFFVVFFFSQQVISILLYKLKHEKDLFVAYYVPVNKYDYVGTWPPFYVDFYPTLGCHKMLIKL